MANIKSAKKRVKVTEKKTAVNRRTKDELKNVLKSFDKALLAEDIEKAEELRATAEKKLMRAAAHHTISKQAASHKVSQVTRKLTAAKAAK